MEKMKFSSESIPASSKVFWNRFRNQIQIRNLFGIGYGTDLKRFRYQNQFRNRNRLRNRPGIIIGSGIEIGFGIYSGIRIGSGIKIG